MTRASVTVEPEGYGWVVMRDGKKLFGAVSAKWRAEEKRDQILREMQHKDRPCIRCNEVFKSEGPHNRLCKSCREYARTVFEGAV